jgi:hypothetical protein
MFHVERFVVVVAHWKRAFGAAGRAATASGVRRLFVRRCSSAVVRVLMNNTPPLSLPTQLRIRHGPAAEAGLPVGKRTVKRASENRNFAVNTKQLPKCSTWNIWVAQLVLNTNNGE